MDILRFYKDFGVDYLTEGHKHCRDGFVNTPCPFCTGNAGYHLSWNIDDEYFICWRCGWKPPMKTLHELTKIPYHELKDIIPAYGINRSKVERKAKGKKEFKLPSGVSELVKGHKRYLRRRGYDPYEIETVWGVQSLSPVSTLDGISYSHRILLPFNWNGQIVSFDSRDVTDKQQNKYQACPKEREYVEHKKILYGNQEAWGKLGIIVEGPTDAWRIGGLAGATSGIKYTPAQVRVIANTFEHVAVVFDSEHQAQIQAKKLVADLKFRGVHAWNEKLKRGYDPGKLKDYEAKELVKRIKNNSKK